MKKPIVYPILSAASVVLAYGKPIEIKGAAAIVLWLVPIVFMIFQAIKNVGILRAAFITVLVCYFASSGLFFLQDHGGVTLAHVETNEHTRVEYCDIDPGAVGSVRCRRTEYFSVFESELLSVRVPRSVEFFRGSYRDMGG